MNKKKMIRLRCEKTEVFAEMDTERWLEALFVPDPVMQAAYEQFEEENAFTYPLEALQAFGEYMGYEFVESDNTYNYESDLDNVIDYTIFSRANEWYYDDSTRIAVRSHQGGDVRGNYASPQFLKPKDDPEISFLAFGRPVVGWSRADGKETEEWETGYSSYPTGRINEDIEKVISCNKKKVEAQVQLKSGEVVRVYPVTDAEFV